MKNLVSVVVPVLNEAENIPALISRFDEIVELNPEYAFEFVVVDDGSTDDTLELLSKNVEVRRDLTVVVLSRNFGSHYALSAGLDAARGEAMIAIGGDLQEPPELVAMFLAQWREGYDVVWGIREHRTGERAIGRWVSTAFTRLLTRFSDLKHYPPQGPSGFLCSRAVAEVLKDLPERNRNLAGLMAWVGFEQGTVQYQLDARNAGKTKWSRAGKLKMAVDSFVEFSFAPIRFMTYIGTTIAVLGFIYAGFLSVRRIFLSQSVEGWTTVVVVVLILGGLQLIVLGVLGEYLWRTADESRRRPLYVVRQTLRSHGDPDSPSGE